MSDDSPLISCLMVTRNRAHIARRALQCFAKQTWEHKELIIVDDGEQDYGPFLEQHRDRYTIRYHRIAFNASRRLGALRNIALDDAGGEFCAQWDDDDWYHPERLETQIRAAQRHDLDAVLLRWTLMHLDTPDFVERPYRTQLRRGTPGTVLHRRTTIRYANLPRGEDSVFRRALARRMRAGIVDDPHSHLFIRCFHGHNTWDIEHFTERLHRRLVDKLHYLNARYVARDLFAHPVFRLTPPERATVRQFLAESRALGIIAR